MPIWTAARSRTRCAKSSRPGRRAPASPTTWPPSAAKRPSTSSPRTLCAGRWTSRRSWSCSPSWNLSGSSTATASGTPRRPSPQLPPRQSAARCLPPTPPAPWSFRTMARPWPWPGSRASARRRPPPSEPSARAPGRRPALTIRRSGAASWTGAGHRPSSPSTCPWPPICWTPPSRTTPFPSWRRPTWVRPCRKMTWRPGPWPCGICGPSWRHC